MRGTRQLLRAARSGLTISRPQTALRPRDGCAGAAHQSPAGEGPCVPHLAPSSWLHQPGPADTMGQGRPDRGTQNTSPAVAAKPPRAAGTHRPGDWLRVAGGGGEGTALPHSAGRSGTQGEAPAPAPSRRAASGPEAANCGQCHPAYRFPRVNTDCPGSGVSVRTTDQAGGVELGPRPAPSPAETPPSVPPTAPSLKGDHLLELNPQQHQPRACMSCRGH
ncbi:unnamed protein product [Rangifer tarandus platyrhynchus]|uniref:Uncharacterized protein n=1 Tax=Rangifer tarandus platyrhynchus TaxID=3082113 RepID=A0ABN8Y4Y3_RANTA|nr:unnamed protein product [Rangifer tarandus platyrhynchus]